MKLNRRTMMLGTLGVLLIGIIVLGIIWAMRSCSGQPTPGEQADSLYTTTDHDTTELIYDASMEEVFAVDSTARPVVAQNYLEELIMGDMGKSLYGLQTVDLELESGEVQNGQTLSSLLNDKYNVNIAVVNQLVEKCKGVFDLRDLRAGKPYTAFLSRDTTTQGELAYLVYEKSNAEFIVFGTSDSIFVRKDKKEITTQERYAEATIESSLWGAIYKNNLPVSLAARLDGIFKWTIDFFAIQKGDSFKVIYEEQFIDTVSIGVGRIFGAEFIHNGKPYLAVRFEQKAKNGDVEIGYWDALGKNLRKNFLSAPLSFTARVSSKFGMRVHPITRRRAQHNGIDYAAPSGTPVLCVADGVVTAKGWDGGGGGNRLWIRHAQGLESAYLHLRGFAKGISTGTRVRQGQVIGYVGSTGRSTGPHLDFRIRQKGKYINPAKTPSTPTDPISAANRPAFDKMKKDVQQVMEEYKKKGAGTR